MKQRFGRFSRLRSVVVDYMLQFNECAIPMGSRRENNHVAAALHLSQAPFAPMQGVLEARVLYTPESSFEAVEGHVALRRLVWDREGDWQRCARRNVIHPDVMSKWFHIDRAGLLTINRSMAALGRRMQSMELDFTVVDLNAPKEPAGPYKIARQSSHIRWIKFHAGNALLDCRFVSRWIDRPFNKAWDRLWDVLGAPMTKANQMQVRMVHDGLDPEKYARALANEVLDG